MAEQLAGQGYGMSLDDVEEWLNGKAVRMYKVTALMKVRPFPAASTEQRQRFTGAISELFSRVVMHPSVQWDGDTEARITLADAHQSRIWDKQAAAYTNAITGVQWRTTRRNKELAMIKLLGRELPGNAPPAAPVDWTELQGRLFAFASPQVLAALKAASDAGQQAESRATNLFALISFAKKSGDHWNREADSTDEIERAIESADRAAQAANDRDDALIDTIRADLHGENGRALKMLTQAGSVQTA